MDAQLECSNWVGSSMGGRLWIHNQFIVYFILNNFLVSVGSMLAGHLDGRNMVHLLKIRPFMRRCSPERMFPSSQWWRCRCYIDTFLLWDSPREFPTSSTAYHSKFIHCSKWSILSDMTSPSMAERTSRSLPKRPDTFRTSEFGVRELLIAGLQVTQVTQLTMPHAISCTASTDPAVSSGSTYRLDLRLLGTVGIWQMPPVRK